jgi:hypothetical protein
MPLGESGSYQWQVHAKPAYREGNAERVLVAVALDPGFKDSSQNDPDRAGIPVVAGHRAKIPQCHHPVEPIAGRAGPGPPQPVQVDDCIGHARLSQHAAHHLGVRPKWGQTGDHTQPRSYQLYMIPPCTRETRV